VDLTAEIKISENVLSLFGALYVELPRCHENLYKNSYHDYGTMIYGTRSVSWGF